MIATANHLSDLTSERKFNTGKVTTLSENVLPKREVDQRCLQMKHQILSNLI